MSTSAIPPDPSQGYYPTDGSTPEGDWAPRVGRPGGLTAVCIIAIVLGGLGLLGSLWGLAGLAFGSEMQKAFAMPKQPGQPGMDNEAVKASNEIQEIAEAMAQRFRAVNLGLLAVNFMVAGCMLAAAIMALKLTPNACTFLAAVFVVAIVFEIIRTSIGVNEQIQTGAAMAEPMSRMMGAIAKGQPRADQAAAMGSMFAKVGVIFGIVVRVGLAIVKTLFYCVGAWYLGRPRIRELFRRTTTEYI